MNEAKKQGQDILEWREWCLVSNDGSVGAHDKAVAMVWCIFLGLWAWPSSFVTNPMNSSLLLIGAYK